MSDETVYSESFKGDKRNYGWSVRFDKTRPEKFPGEPAYVGITQFDDDKVKDRVLLSPPQIEELIKFVRQVGKP